MKPDFSGYATRANVKCSDGRTILPNAFKDNDGTKVPLVWQHGHNSPDNILGHATLENRDDGVYAYGYFNNTPGAKNAKTAVEHGDVDSLSIYANKLVERNQNVMHGTIREVSLVLSGANPEARIDNVTIQHSDGYVEDFEDQAIITTGGELKHADGGSEKTVEDVVNEMTEEQKNVLYYLVGTAAQEAEAEAVDDDDDDDDDDELAQAYYPEGPYLMHKNVFEGGSMTATDLESGVISHTDKTQGVKNLNEVIQHAAEYGTLKNALEANLDGILEHAINMDTDYGINTLELLFPEAKMLNGDKPEAIRRQQEWVKKVLSGVSKRPFSRIKMMHFDMTHEEARARGYIRGNLKKEMFWSVVKRTTEPTTVYQKQKIDRDDIIDITTVDVVQWMWQEMRISLDEEIARAILVGDGREIDDPDKIQEDKIRPIVKEDDFYAHKVGLPESVTSDGIKLIDEIFRVRKAYKGSGSPMLYTSEAIITDLMLLRDPTFDKRHFDSKEALARALNVSGIVEVDDAMFYGTDLIGIIVNLSDYAVGTDKGGEITTFDDFDIDYNQYKYLIEGRMSGALIKPKSAIVISKTSGSEVTESSPLINPEPTHEPTTPEGAYRSTGPKGPKTFGKGGGEEEEDVS